jgi:hypothetical protein
MGTMGELRLKRARTDRIEVIGTVHVVLIGIVRGQSPPQPSKVDPARLVAVKVTDEVELVLQRLLIVSEPADVLTIPQEIPVPLM